MATRIVTSLMAFINRQQIINNWWTIKSSLRIVLKTFPQWRYFVLCRPQTATGSVSVSKQKSFALRWKQTTLKNMKHRFPLRLNLLLFLLRKCYQKSFQNEAWIVPDCRRHTQEMRTEMKHRIRLFRLLFFYSFCRIRFQMNEKLFFNEKHVSVISWDLHNWVSLIQLQFRAGDDDDCLCWRRSE